MKTLLILHGWGSCAKNWGRVKELLENQGCKVYVPDLPGFGENPPPQKPWSIDDYVDWLKQYIDNLSQISGAIFEPFFLLGHSFGGAIAVKFSIKYPKKIQKLFLVDSIAIRRKTFKKEIIKKISNILKKFSFLPFYQFLRKTFYKLIVRKSDYLATQGIMRETYLMVINKDLSGYLSDISVPTVIIWGEKDELTPLKDAYLIKEKISNSTLEILPRINHNPHSEAPEILVEKILNFIKR